MITIFSWGYGSFRVLLKNGKLKASYKFSIFPLRLQCLFNAVQEIQRGNYLIMSFLTSLRSLTFLTAITATSAFAADPTQQHNSNAVWFESWSDLSNAMLKVVAPNGAMTEVFTATGTPVFQLQPRDALDGVYRYELSAATSEQITIVNAVDNGRGENASDTQAKPYHMSGSFVVSRGVIIQPEKIVED